MFDRINLSPKIVGLLNAVTPALILSGTLSEFKAEISTKFFSLQKEQFFSTSQPEILLHLPKMDYPEELTLNILRKGDDTIIEKVYREGTCDREKITASSKIGSPTYQNSILTLELRKEEEYMIINKHKIAIYEVLHGSGVTGLDTAFNDDITLAKTIEVMSPTQVDNLVVKKRIKE